jgi:DNA-binding transcriptional regulator YdaS (Cro superfamily)
MDVDKARVRRVVVRAAARLGDSRALAQRLGVTVEAVNEWIDGDGEPSLGHFIQMIDIVFDVPYSAKAR